MFNRILCTYSIYFILPHFNLLFSKEKLKAMIAIVKALDYTDKKADELFSKYHQKRPLGDIEQEHGYKKKTSTRPQFWRRSATNVKYSPECGPDVDQDRPSTLMHHPPRTADNLMKGENSSRKAFSAVQHVSLLQWKR